MPPADELQLLTIDAGINTQAAPKRMRLDPDTGDLTFWALAVDKQREPNRCGFIFDWDSPDDVHVESLRQNPTFLYFHDSERLAIGTIEDIRINTKRVMMQIRIPGIQDVPEEIRGDELYQTREVVKHEILSGRLRGVSIGFYIRRAEEAEQGVLLKEVEIVELSVCTIGAHATALIQQKVDARLQSYDQPQLETQQEHKWLAIPYDRHGDEDTVAKDTEWSGPDQVDAAEVDDLKQMCLFEDQENLDIKGGYKGPHHTADGNRVVWRGVAAAMAALLGARGGFEGISDTEHRQGYDHLVKHYEQFDEEPPQYERQALDTDRLNELHDQGRIIIPGRELPQTPEQKLKQAADLIREVLGDQNIEVRLITPQPESDQSPPPATPGETQGAAPAADDADQMEQWADELAAQILASPEMQKKRQDAVRFAMQHLHRGSKTNG